MTKVVLLKNLKAGDMFRRVGGEFRYVVSSQREERCGNVSVYCYNLDGVTDGYWQGGSEKVVSLMSDTAQPKDKTPSRFWMCYVEDGGMPSHKHYTHLDACTEAERLAKSTGRRVFVLSSLSCVAFAIPLRLPSEYKWESTIV